MKILSIKKRNALMRFLSIEDWRVQVEMPDGSIKKINCWAGGHSSPASVSHLMHSIEMETGEPYFGEFLQAEVENRPPRIQGIEKAYLAIENKHVHQAPGAGGGALGGTITIGVQSQNQTQVETRTRVKTAAEIQSQLRSSTSVRSGVGIRRGK